MNRDLESQLERMDEFQRDLEIELNKCLTERIVSDRARNILQDLLVKCTLVLDQTMFAFYKKKIVPALTDTDADKLSRHVYFPISSDKNALFSELGKSRMGKIAITQPEIFNILQNVQTYQSKDNYWLHYVKIYGRQKKHVKLIPQTIKEENETLLGNAIFAGRGSKVEMSGCLINGMPLNCDDVNNAPLENFDPRLDVKRTTWVSFQVLDDELSLRIDTNTLSKDVVKGTRRIVDQFDKIGIL